MRALSLSRTKKAFMDSLFPLTMSLTLSDPKLTVMAGDVTKQAGVCVCVTERGRERECEKESTRKTARDKAGGMDGTKEGGGQGVSPPAKSITLEYAHTLSLFLSLFHVQMCMQCLKRRYLYIDAVHGRLTCIPDM